MKDSLPRDFCIAYIPAGGGFDLVGSREEAALWIVAGCGDSMGVYLVRAKQFNIVEEKALAVEAPEVRLRGWSYLGIVVS